MCIEVPIFQQENINTVAQLMDPQDKLVTVDLKNGFFMYLYMLTIGRIFDSNIKMTLMCGVYCHLD